MDALLGGLPGGPSDQQQARELATLPMRLGGLGVRSARRIAPAACWASWADSLHMMQSRLPEVADAIIQRLVHVPEPGGCLHELKSAGNALDHHGFVSRPGWIQPDHLPCKPLNLPSGHTDGNTTRPPLLNTISGGPCC